MKRILIQGANWVGDALMSTPVLVCVRAAFPQAHLSVLTVPWVEGVYGGHPCVDGKVVYERGGRHRGAKGKRMLMKELRQGRFEMAILLPNSFESALLAYMANIPVRVGYRTDGRGALLTHGIQRDQKVMARHQVGYYLGIPHSL
ncbi:MAG: glycosyltransferase family 9 protein, partial [candidate division NC10 bacterium]|nr:glycosyltransferase family 9 protein [candidate division NC10 bacterium]